MKNEEFVEASAYLRVLEKKMLSAESVVRIADATGVSETLRLLGQNSGYDFSSLKKTEDYENVLKDELMETYKLLYRLSPYPEIIDIPAAKYDFHNLKVCLKAKHLAQDFKHLYFTVTDLSVSDLESFAAKGDRKDYIPSYIAEAISEAENAFEDTGDPQVIDTVSDKHMFAHMLALCQEAGNDFITEYVKTNIDLCNIKTLMRVKSIQKGTGFLSGALIPGGLTDTGFFIKAYDKTADVLSGIFCFKHFGDAAVKGIEEFGKTGNYAGLEKFLDNCLIDFVKQTKYITYGPEVLFAYIVSKENEIRQIRILVTCKKNGVDTEALKERLRENYA